MSEIMRTIILSWAPKNGYVLKQVGNAILIRQYYNFTSYRYVTTAEVIDNFRKQILEL